MWITSRSESQRNFTVRTESQSSKVWITSRSESQRNFTVRTVTIFEDWLHCVAKSQSPKIDQNKKQFNCIDQKFCDQNWRIFLQEILRASALIRHMIKIVVSLTYLKERKGRYNVFTFDIFKLKKWVPPSRIRRQKKNWLFCYDGPDKAQKLTFLLRPYES